MRSYYFHKRTILIGLMIILAITFVNIVSAATIRVNMDGEGDYSSIQEAVNAAKEGDIVMVDPGTYKESVTIDKKITLIGSGPGATAIYTTAGNAVTFEEGSGEASIIGFSITSAGENGIYCDYNTSSGISNCVISGGRNGIYCNSDSKAGISNNVIIGCGSNGVETYFSSPSIANNIIVENGGYGITKIDYGQESPTSSYNDFWNNVRGEYGGNESDIMIGTGNISLDPLFVDPGVDFHLREGSPCIDAGKPGFAYLDPDGTRNDMGAYGGPYAAISSLLGPVVTELEVMPTSVKQGGTITIKATGSVK